MLPSPNTAPPHLWARVDSPRALMVPPRAACRPHARHQEEISPQMPSRGTQTKG